ATPCNVMIWSEGMLLSSLDMLKAIGFDMVVFDESSKLKSHKAQLSKAALELSSVVPSWYNLSATPAPNGEHEYYTQMRVVDPYAFPTARSRFISKYFDNVSRDPKWEKLRIKPDMRQAFMQVVDEYSIYVDQAVMPMAGKVWHDDLLYEMSDTTKEQYKRMANGMAAEVQGQIITAEQAASMRAKLNQITSGFLLDTDAIKQNKLMRKLGEDSGSTEAYRLPEHERLDYLSKLLQYIDSNEPGTPVVIWANYAEEFAMLQELLGSNAGYIRGGTTTAGREEIIRAFRERKLQYLVAHPLSVGMGINLTVSHNAVYYSVNDSWEALKQSSERICGHITVQPTPCHYWVIQAKETVNVLIYNNVKGKRDASIGFMEHLKAAVLL
ncbi:MAG: DEAD/DEAH box helicase, partial [Acinetobacter sp.]